jgi:glycosyltransferase involved in cell wall biosynthesis
VKQAPRVAFFTDSFHDVNGVAHTSRQLEAFARRRNLPILSAHAGPKTATWREGECLRVEFGRSRSQVPLDDGLAFDPWILRFWDRSWKALDEFRPDVIHITGPGDLGWLGMLLAWRRGVPLVASWHTNLHEYAARRLPIAGLRQKAQDSSFWGLMLFYKIAKVCLAPNEELRSMIATHTGRATFLMERGIDTDLFSPDRRKRTGDELVLGYVGRLRPEKNVQLLADVERHLIAAGISNYRFLVVGDGSQRDWLRQNLKKASFPGVLKGEALAEAYASMDVFLFPSWTDTYGNVVAEALASGVPAVVTSGGGPKFLVKDGASGLVARSDAEYGGRVLELAQDRAWLKRMSGEAREWAVGRSWDSVFDKVWLCYKQAAASIASCPAPFATAS